MTPVTLMTAGRHLSGMVTSQLLQEPTLLRWALCTGRWSAAPAALPRSAPVSRVGASSRNYTGNKLGGSPSRGSRACWLEDQACSLLLRPQQGGFSFCHVGAVCLWTTFLRTPSPRLDSETRAAGLP